MSPVWNPLHAAPSYPADHYARLADRIGRILKTRNDILLVQAEAVVALEAVASSLARPGLSALNIVTSPYGGWFGQWLRRGGASVRDVIAEPGLPVTAASIEAALDAHPDTGVLSIVHAESASGILNPLKEIVALARARRIVTVVDAVASVGGHALDVDGLGIDVAIIGPQKSLGGPAGISALSVSTQVWRLIEEAAGPSASVLSLTDLKAWIDEGRGALPGTPAALQFFALEAALDLVENEGLEMLIRRHERAAEATRSGLLALGARPWVTAAEASNLVTAAVVPDGISPTAIIDAAQRLGVEMTAGVGAISERIVRLNHTGARAAFQPVLSNVVAYGAALRENGIAADIGAAAEAVAKIYRR
jgi:aspartate aminotransferase-like enzyme